MLVDAHFVERGNKKMKSEKQSNFQQAVPTRDQSLSL